MDYTRFYALLEKIQAHGYSFPGYNKPVRAKEGRKQKMAVLARKGSQTKLVHFGHRSYDHNYSEAAKKNYLKRSAGIKDGRGNLTKNDKFSANYWARKVLWPKGQKADGSAKKT